MRKLRATGLRAAYARMLSAKPCPAALNLY